MYMKGKNPSKKNYKYHPEFIFKLKFVIVSKVIQGKKLFHAKDRHLSFRNQRDTYNQKNLCTEQHFPHRKPVGCIVTDNNKRSGQIMEGVYTLVLCQN